MIAPRSQRFDCSLKRYEICLVPATYNVHTPTTERAPLPAEVRIAPPRAAASVGSM